jgi:phosphoenolpyruvate carboxylase
MLDSFESENTKAIFDLMGKCVERIIDGETIHERADFNKKELTDFLDSLNTKQFAEMQKFFETMPKLSHVVEYTNPNTKKKHKKTLEGLNSFFA